LPVAEPRRKNTGFPRRVGTVRARRREVLRSAFTRQQTELGVQRSGLGLLGGRGGPGRRELGGRGGAIPMARTDLDAGSRHADFDLAERAIELDVRRRVPDEVVGAEVCREPTHLPGEVVALHERHAVGVLGQDAQRLDPVFEHAE
jgi:hypothetical protein